MFYVEDYGAIPSSGPWKKKRSWAFWSKQKQVGPDCSAAFQVCVDACAEAGGGVVTSSTGAWFLIGAPVYLPPLVGMVAMRLSFPGGSTSLRYTDSGIIVGGRPPT